MPVRAAQTSAIRSASRRRATKPRICAEALVEPLRVVDDADAVAARSATSANSVNAASPTRNRSGAGPVLSPNTVASASPLRDWQPVEVIQHGRTKLVEAAVGQLHLRLDADGRRDVPAGDSIGQVAQQRALADACLAAQHRDSTPTGERVGQKPSALRARSDVRGASNAEPDPGSSAASRRQPFAQ